MLTQILRESRFSPSEDLFACGHCGQLYRRRQLHAGRGRHAGEHPDHEYAPCGHSQTWFGKRPVRACAHCGDPLPAATPLQVAECDPCFEWLNSTSGEDGATPAALGAVALIPCAVPAA